MVYDKLGRVLMDDDLVMINIGRKLVEGMVTAGGLLTKLIDGKRVPTPLPSRVLLMVPRGGDHTARWSEIIDNRVAMRAAYREMAMCAS